MQINKKKILYVWKSEYPWEIRIKKITQSLVAAGFDTYVLAKYNGEEKDSEIIDNGVKVIRFGREFGRMILPVPFNPVWKRAINVVIKTLQPDLIIVREIMLAEMTAKLGRKYNVPVIMDMAENYPACMREWRKYNSNFIKRFLVHQLKYPDMTERKSVKLCDGIMVVCDEQIERLNRLYNYDKEKICVIENTPEDDFLSKTNYAEVDLKYKLENNLPIIFGHHGNLSGVTSLENFLFAFEKLSEKYKLKFVISGTGEYENYCKNIVNKLKSKNNIHFTGRYNYTDLPNMLNDIDIGVTPYQAFNFNNFTLYNKTYCYMAAGKPVLTSMFNPHIRLFNETKAGLALDFTTVDNAVKSIEEMIHSDTISMSKNGRKAVLEKYNWNTDATKMINFLNKYMGM
ncbi:MAG: glycosyltransferase [Bacteroidetes bacterium]|nr:glycosyltransferase [Bacteroidota bacterium]